MLNLNEMKPLTALLLIFSIAALYFFACTGGEKEGGPRDYAIPAGVAAHVESDTVVIISSQQQFSNAFGEAGTKLPAVNFDESALAVVTGEADHPIMEVSTTIISRLTKGWDLKIVVKHGNGGAPQPWTVAYLVPCGTKASDIRLRIENE